MNPILSLDAGYPDTDIFRYELSQIVEVEALKNQGRGNEWKCDTNCATLWATSQRVIFNHSLSFNNFR